MLVMQRITVIVWLVGSERMQRKRIWQCGSECTVAELCCSLVAGHDNKIHGVCDRNGKLISVWEVSK